jgi:hypothetical protein
LRPELEATPSKADGGIDNESRCVSNAVDVVKTFFDLSKCRGRGGNYAVDHISILRQLQVIGSSAALPKSSLGI